jgi:ankyrin repeat protein
MNARFLFRNLWQSQFLRGGFLPLIALAWSGRAFGGEIHIAASNGDIEKVKALVQADPGLVSSTDDKGDTPLLAAVKFRHRDIAAFLLAHNANANAHGKDESFALGDGGGTLKSLGGTPLHWAAQSGDKDMVELLLTSRADVNATNNGTPLHWAILGANQEVVRLLLANKSDVNAKDDHGQTPLHIAAVGHKDLVELLLANGANVNARANDGQTPLHVVSARSAFGRALDIAGLLVTRGANVNARDNDGETPLLLAAKYCVGDITMAQWLLAHGADVNAKDKKGYTPLTVPKDYACPKLTELLQERGADGRAAKETNLINAAQDGDAKAVRALLKKNPHAVSQEDGDGNTPLDLAALYGLKDVVRLLATDKASANARNSFGATPLHYAVREGQIEVVTWLLAKGADVNARDSLGWTPLHQAAWGCSQQVAALLLAHGANVNATNNDGWTPLHWAASDGCTEEVEYLLAHNAAINAKNNDGDTPLRLATAPDAVRCLRQHGGHE